MRGKTKVLGLALVAAFVVSAVGAAGAWGKQGELTASKYPAAITAEAEEGEGFASITAGNAKFECESISAEALITAATTQINGVGHFEECVSGENPVTVHLNGCTSTITIGTITESGVIHGSAHLNCPTGKKVEATIIAFGSPICAIDIPPQTVTASVSISNVAGGEGKTPQDYITVSGDISEKGKYTETDLSFFCPFTNNHTTEDARLFGAAIIKGYEYIETDGTTGNVYTHNSKEVGIDVGGT